MFFYVCLPVGGGGTRLAMLGLMSGRKEEGGGLTSLLPGDMYGGAMELLGVMGGVGLPGTGDEG